MAAPDSDSLPIQIHIALYHIGRGQGAYHWSLVISEGPPGEDPVNVYQAIDNKYKVWELQHEKQILPRMGTFFGCVEIASSVNAPLEDIDAFIRAYPAEEELDTRLPHSTPWSCACWVLRILYDLNEAGLITIPPDMTRVRQRVMAKGMLLEKIEKRVPILPLETGI